MVVDAVIVPIAGPTSAAPAPIRTIPIRAVPARTIADDVAAADVDVVSNVDVAFANARPVRLAGAIATTDDWTIASSSRTVSAPNARPIQRARQRRRPVYIAQTRPVTARIWANVAGPWTVVGTGPVCKFRTIAKIGPIARAWLVRNIRSIGGDATAGQRWPAYRFDVRRRWQRRSVCQARSTRSRCRPGHIGPSTTGRMKATGRWW